MDAVATTQISRLRKMNLKELHAQYQRLFNTRCKSNNREWVFKTVARKIQGDDLPESGKRSTAVPAKITSAKPSKAQGRKERDPRLPKVGATIEREYHGKLLKVAVVEDGFTFHGKHYRSLSGLAAEITGSVINGFAFFRLT